MKPYYDHAGITIYHGDCRELTIDAEAVVTDPPWGMAWDTDSTRFSGGQRDVGRGDGRDDWAVIHGDDEPFDPTPWLGYEQVVLWGSNHFAQRLPVGTTLVWIKKPDHLFGTFLSDCEVAWMKGGHGVYAFRKNFPPPSRMAETFGVCAHPNQKPIGLLEWSIRKTGCKGTVFDPYMGSGTTLVAAKNLGLRAVGAELEERYCEIAAKRLAQEVLFT